MPSLSATISLNSAGPLIVEQQVMATVVISNSSGSNIQILEIDPKINKTGNPVPVDGSSAALGKVPLSGSVNQIVKAGSSSSFNFFVTIHEPSINYDGSAGTYSISCNVIGQNGEIISPASPATIQVNVIPKEASTP